MTSGVTGSGVTLPTSSDIQMSHPMSHLDVTSLTKPDFLALLALLAHFLPLFDWVELGLILG